MPSEQVARQYPRVTVAWADSGYKRSVIDTGAAYGIDVQVVTKDPQQRGFVPQRKHQGREVKDRVSLSRPSSGNHVRGWAGLGQSRIRG